MATVTFACSTCGKQFRVIPEQAGRRVRCPHCETPNSVPSGVFAPPEPPKASPEQTTELTRDLQELATSVKELSKHREHWRVSTVVRSRIDRLPPYWALLVFDRLCVALAIVCVMLTIVLMAIADSVPVPIGRTGFEDSGSALPGVAFIALCGALCTLSFMVVAHWTRAVRDSCLHLANIVGSKHNRDTGAS